MIQSDFKVIGLTGGIATGKSTVANIIKGYGYKVIDADRIARDVVEMGKPAYKKIVKDFGEKILNKDKSLNRKKLGDIIFKDKSLREKLNNIVHPYVFKTIKGLIIEYSQSEKYIFVDVPLLIEEIDKFKEYGIYFDEIWLVYTDEEAQLNRLIKRDMLNEKEALKRIKAQMPIDLKREYATKIIDNRGNIKTLKKQMEKVIYEII
ncbi:MAG: dephospho-CoA kinase [Tissierellia bacterium]|nr:dephospho-CoA kinase [Tissierellia bacterium]